MSSPVHLLIFLALCSMAPGLPGGSFSMMEICNNALDDDMDGLIDLNDPDCQCELIEPKSLIPNPSFEEMECCPGGRSALHCADTWIQASEATTDYLHSCGWNGWADLPPPMPYPDGEACIGFRDGRFDGDEPNPNWKEYTGACLTEPLRAGNTYRLDFHLGFTNMLNSPPLNIVFYGSTDCNNLPFGVDDQRHGCPLNGPGWTQLDIVSAFGENNWIQRSFEVTPEQDIYAIAIGPDCFERSYTDDIYYFLDNLILADIREFEFSVSVEGNPCQESYSLSVPQVDSLEYQWYRDGIALVGENGPNLERNVQDGNYRVRLTGSQVCRVTRPFPFRVPHTRRVISNHFCESGSFLFGGVELDEPGTYYDTLRTRAGCDSVIELQLTMASSQEVDVDAKIFRDESFRIGSFSFENEGQETVLLQSSQGCDSLVHLNLSFYEVYAPTAFSPNGDGVNDQFEIQGGTDLISVRSLYIFDRWGGLVYDATASDSGDQVLVWDGGTQGISNVGTYTFLANLLMDDGLEHRLTGTVALIR